MALCQREWEGEGESEVQRGRKRKRERGARRRRNREEATRQAGERKRWAVARPAGRPTGPLPQQQKAWGPWVQPSP